MKLIFSFTVFLAFFHSVSGQNVKTENRGSTMLEDQDKITIETYIDIYYSFDFNKPQDGNRPYFVSMDRHNEVNINLAFIALRYASSRVRANFIPGFGSYMNSNYAEEEGTIKNIVEANAGFKLFDKKEIWLDVGVFGSPFTNESAISRGHLAYTRSMAPEYVPYYLAGAKLTLPLSPKVNLYFYVLNGWQQIKDQNSNKAVATQLEFRPNDHLLLNWNTFIGKESSAIEPDFVGRRFFTDAYFIYNRNKWALTGNAYIGNQELSSGKAIWLSTNLIVQYSLTDKLSVVSRIEYFEDTKSVQIVPITSLSGFSATGGSLGINYKITDNLLFRTEGRSFFSKNEVYVRNGHNTSHSSMVTTNFTVWF